MRYRTLGRSGLQVSEIALGGWLNLGGWLSEKDSIFLIHQAFAAGVNLFDVADVYADGACEVVLGKALKALPREQIVLATKCRYRMWPGPAGEGLSKKHIIQACEDSLRRLQVDHIDLYQAHHPDADTPIEETMAAFDLLVRQGKVLYLCSSNFSGKEITAANKAAKDLGGSAFKSNQPQYNMLHREAEQELFPACKKLGVGNIVYSPLAHGVLSGKYKSLDGITEGRLAHWQPENNFLTEENLAKVEQLNTLAGEYGMTCAQLALRWCLRRPEVAAVIVGASKPNQLDENTAAGNMALTGEQLQAIEAVISPA